MEEADFEGERYLWRCPDCEDITEDESDIRGQKVECHCGWEGTVAG